MSHINGSVYELDKEWMMLILEAKKLGLRKEEVSNFLANWNKEQLIGDPNQ